MKNIGTTDRMLRIILAIIFSVLYFTETVTGTIGIVLIILSMTLLLTSLARTCPLYMPFKLSTVKKEN